MPRRLVRRSPAGEGGSAQREGGATGLQGGWATGRLGYEATGLHGDWAARRRGHVAASPAWRERGTRCRPRRGAALAWFDAGYLIESYRQASHVARYDMLSGGSRRGWTMAVEPKADGYALVRKALALAGSDAGMEFAASLMTTGATADAHRRRASATAPAGSKLAQHVARSR